MAEPRHAELTSADEALIEKIAWRMGDKIVERMENRINEKIRQHMLECPTTETVKDFRARAGGFVLAFTMIGSFLGAVLVVVGRAIWNETTRK